MKNLLIALISLVLVNESFAQKIEVIPPSGIKKAVTMSGGATIDANGVVALNVSGAGSLILTIEGAGSAIVTGYKGAWTVPYNCTINSVTMVADQTGSIVVDIWKDTYANYPPTVADTITASAKPTITAALKSQDLTLTGWNKTVTAGDVLAFNVDSASGTITRLAITLSVTK